MGSPSAFLRSGPGSTPVGKGSLNLLVGGNTKTETNELQKVAYGNEIDFAGTPLSSMTAVGFNVYTTGEDITAGNGTPNMPGIAFEIDPNVTGKLALLVPGLHAEQHGGQHVERLHRRHQGRHRPLGPHRLGVRRNEVRHQRHPMHWDELQTYLAENNNGTPAKITYSVGVTKGRDFSWQGAVDGLRINGTVFDFEETGVFARPVAA